jgi:glucose-6-phosphate-specific signal transduction histidine kinase
MNALLHNFEESLREELKCYGELLALLEDQRQHVARTLPDEVLASVSEINTQTDTIQAVRGERAQRQSELAQSLALEPGTRISTLIPSLPAAHQPLVTALVNENNQLLARIKQLARHNHVVLTRAVGLIEKFIGTICSAGTPLYNGAGAKLRPSPGRALYEGLG